MTASVLISAQLSASIRLHKRVNPFRVFAWSKLMYCLMMNLKPSNMNKQIIYAVALIERLPWRSSPPYLRLISDALKLQQHYATSDSMSIF